MSHDLLTTLKLFITSRHVAFRRMNVKPMMKENNIGMKISCKATINQLFTLKFSLKESLDPEIHAETDVINDNSYFLDNL